MIKCEDCTALFENSELQTEAEYIPFHDDYTVVPVPRCPICGSTEVKEVEVHSCYFCGELKAEEDMQFKHFMDDGLFYKDWVCNNCIKENNL